MKTHAMPTPPAPAPAPRDLMERAIARLGSPAAVARRLRVTPSHVSRLCKGTSGVSADLALRLADLLGADRSFVLRVCGHTRFAALIYPSGDPERSRVQDAIDELPKDDRRLIQTLIDRLLFLTATSPKGLREDAPKGGVR